MYIQRIAENLVQNAFLGFEIFRFEVDAYMYVQKTFFSAVYLSSLHVEEGGRESTPCDLDADPGDPETDPDPVVFICHFWGTKKRLISPPPFLPAWPVKEIPFCNL